MHQAYSLVLLVLTALLISYAAAAAAAAEKARKVLSEDLRTKPLEEPTQSTSQVAYDDHSSAFNTLATLLLSMRSTPAVALVSTPAVAFQGVFLPSFAQQHHVGFGAPSNLHSRHVPAKMQERMPKKVPPTQAEMMRIPFVGLWSGSVELDTGKEPFSIQLQSEYGKCQIESTPPEEIAFKSKGSRKCDWGVELQGDDVIITVVFGDLILQGIGTRSSTTRRFDVVEGTVLEGITEPVYVGRFKMGLIWSALDDEGLRQLQKEHQARRDKKPIPDRYRFSAFPGKWKLQLVFQLESKENKNLGFVVELGDDGRFVSENQTGNDGQIVRMGGSWGVWEPSSSAEEGTTSSKRKMNRGVGIETPLVGTHFFLHLDRTKSTGLPVFFEPYSLYGKPTLPVFDSQEAAIMAEVQAKQIDVGYGHTDLVNGNVYLKINSREWIVAGSFSLRRWTKADDQYEGLMQARYDNFTNNPFMFR